MEKNIPKPCKADLLKLVAERLFAAYGYEGASTRQIADEAGVNISAITYYFESKEGLYKAIFKGQLTELHETLKQIANMQVSAYDKLDRFLDLYIGRLNNQQNFHKLLQREISSQIHTAIKEGILSRLMENSVILKQTIDEGMDNGTFKKVDTSLYILTVLNMLYQVIGRSPFAARLLQNNENFAEENINNWIKNYLFDFLKPA